jgi:hypothetical protein
MEWIYVANGRLGSRSRGYHPFAPRPVAAGPFCTAIYFCPSFPEALHVIRHVRPLLVKDRITGEKLPVNLAGQFDLRFRLPRKSQGSLTCRKSATWDRRLYFPSEGRDVVDFFARKIQRHRPGSNPRTWVLEASMLTTRPPSVLVEIGPFKLYSTTSLVV